MKRTCFSPEQRNCDHRRYPGMSVSLFPPFPDDGLNSAPSSTPHVCVSIHLQESCHLSRTISFFDQAHFPFFQSSSNAFRMCKCCDLKLFHHLDYISEKLGCKQNASYQRGSKRANKQWFSTCFNVSPQWNISCQSPAWQLRYSYFAFFKKIYIPRISVKVTPFKNLVFGTLHRW